MKINDLLPFTTQEKRQSTLSSCSDFEAWLSTPTKQSSGDEFYWQHQEQLQVSDLTFTALVTTKPIQNSHHTQMKRIKEQSMDATTVPKNTISEHVRLTQDRNLDCIKNTLPLSNTTMPSYKSTLKAPPSLVTKTLFEKKPSPIKNHKAILFSPHQDDSKRHHLFIHNKEAEFSLNTEDLSDKEQSELIQQFKNYLKQKGYFLKQLIINGVCHD